MGGGVAPVWPHARPLAAAAAASAAAFCAASSFSCAAYCSSGRGSARAKQWTASSEHAEAHGAAATAHAGGAMHASVARHMVGAARHANLAAQCRQGPPTRRRPTCIMPCTAACTLASSPPTRAAKRAGSPCWMPCSVSAGGGPGTCWAGQLACQPGRAERAARQRGGMQRRRWRRRLGSAWPHAAGAVPAAHGVQPTRKIDKGVHGIDGGRHLILLVLAPVLVVWGRGRRSKGPGPVGGCRG